MATTVQEDKDLAAVADALRDPQRYPRRSEDPDERFWIGLGRKIAQGPAVRIPDGYDRNRRR
jgi:hypothetical protein